MSRQRHEAPRALGREARELLASARDGGGPPPGVKARVRGAIGVALAGGAVASVGTVGAAKTLAGGALGGSSAVGSSAVGAVASGVAIAGGVGLGVKVALAVVVFAAVGSALVQLTPSPEAAVAPTQDAPVVTEPAFEPSTEPSTNPSVIALSPTALAPDALAPDELAPSALPVVTEAPRAVRRARPTSDLVEAAAPTAPASAPAAEPGSTLMDEMALLSPARAALARGDSDAAREAVTRYRARYPSGAFTEEFAAIEVQALCASGDPSAAATRARFERAHPGSTYAARVARACD